MEPPRLPLQDRFNITANDQNHNITSDIAAKAGPTPTCKATKTPRLLPSEDFAEFKNVVNGSELKKAQLLKMLKQR